MTPMSWTAGYVAEIDYTYGYYRELSPSLLRVACLNAGLTPASSGAADLSRAWLWTGIVGQHSRRRK